jgi:hypothetical protein
MRRIISAAVGVGTGPAARAVVARRLVLRKVRRFMAGKDLITGGEAAAGEAAVPGWLGYP